AIFAKGTARRIKRFWKYGDLDRGDEVLVRERPEALARDANQIVLDVLCALVAFFGIEFETLRDDFSKPLVPALEFDLLAGLRSDSFRRLVQQGPQRIDVSRRLEFFGFV